MDNPIYVDQKAKSILSSRTFWVNLLTPLFLWVSVRYGIDLDADTQTLLITGIMILVNIGMRRLTSDAVAFTLPQRMFNPKRNP